MKLTSSCKNDEKCSPGLRSVRWVAALNWKMLAELHEMQAGGFNMHCFVGLEQEENMTPNQIRQNCVIRYFLRKDRL